jgi:stress-induced morphogen
MQPIEQIRTKILAAVPDAQVIALDPQGDGQHFEAIVISPAFEGMPLVRRHQLVMNALKEEFVTRVHALRLRTLTPQQWQAEQGSRAKGAG